MRGGRGAGHGDSPSGKDRTAGWGTPRQGSLPGELRVLARHLQIGCRGTGTRGNHPRIRCRHLTQQENDRVALCNTNKQTNKLLLSLPNRSAHRLTDSDTSFGLIALFTFTPIPPLSPLVGHRCNKTSRSYTPILRGPSGSFGVHTLL